MSDNVTDQQHSAPSAQRCNTSIEPPHVCRNGDGDADQALHRIEVRALHFLAGFTVPVWQYELAELVEVHRDTLRPWLVKLLRDRLITQPHGKRSGYLLTTSGKSKLAAQSPETLHLCGLPGAAMHRSGIDSAKS